MIKLISLYYKLPVFIQNVAISIHGYILKNRRFNKVFKKELEKFERSDPNNVNVDCLRNFLLKSSDSPFWKRRFSDYGVDIYSFDPISEISKLPIITKAEVKNNIEDIKNKKCKSKIYSVNTSGTTGSGLVFIQTKIMVNKQWAIWWRFRRRHGIDLNMWQGWFGGRSIINVNDRNPPYWRVNFFGKQILFSLHHLNVNTVIYYYDEIIRRNLKWLHGYPSQIAYFASLMKERFLHPLKLQFITLGAENLLIHQIEIIQEMFGVTPIQHYGLAEGVANISQLSDGEFQVDQDFAYVEFIETDFSSEVFKIIGTNYSNNAFPLIRYDTGDYVRIKKYGVDKLRIQNIDGRNEDYITLPNGIKLGRLDHIFKNATYVKEAQIYQPSIDKIILKIVPGVLYNKKIHESKILKECRERLGSDISINFEYQNQISRTKSGKFKFVISDVKN